MFSSNDIFYLTISRLLVFSHPQSRGSEFSLRTGQSSWSKVCLSIKLLRITSSHPRQIVSLEAPSAETELILDSPSTGEEVYLGLSWELGLGKYKLSKVVTIAPRFVLKNNLLKTLCFREHGVPPQEKATLDPTERAMMQVMKAREEKLLTVTYSGLNAQWCGVSIILDLQIVDCS